MISFKDFFFKKETKAVPYITLLEETTRQGVNKAYIPKFLYKPPFGYPRFANMPYIRGLAQTPYVEMCVNTIIDEITSIPWDIVITEGVEDEADEQEISHIKNFFMNPNTNMESFEDVFIKMPVRDILEINTGVLNKVFNLKGDMVEIVARDGATFTKNPDIHGMMTYREDILIPKIIVNNPGEAVNSFMQIPANVVTEKAAYFQYGWISGPVPVPFGKREIVWLQKMMRTDDIYAYSPVMVLAKSLQMLLYQIESDLEYYNNNNVPKGIIGIDNSDAEEIQAFKDQWKEMQLGKDEFGNTFKRMNVVPIVNKIPEFKTIEFSSSELQIIEKQAWYTKMVWASFGVTPTELGYTEDARGQANQIVQSKVFRKKAINPMLRLLMNRYNMDIVSEFGYVSYKNTSKGRVEVPKYQFKFLTFDIDEERAKAELYKLQIDGGMKTVNEIRLEEGKEEVEWGNNPPSQWQGGSGGVNLNLNNPRDVADEDYRANQRSDAEGKAEFTKDGVTMTYKEIIAEHEKLVKILEEGDPEKIKEEAKEQKKELDEYKKEAKTEGKAIESKPFASYDNFDDCVTKNKDKENPEAYCAVIMRATEGKDIEVKASSMANFLERALKEALDAQQKILDDMSDEEFRSFATKDLESKGFNDLIAKLQSVLSFNFIKKFTSDAVKEEYLKGQEQAEKHLNMNFQPNWNAIEFLTNYTFDNIKDASDDMINKIRQELQRAVMNGDSVYDIKKNLHDVIDVSKTRAQAIARTETNRAHNTGRLMAYKSSGVPGNKVYKAHIDDRTSEICKRLDGQKVGLDDDFVDSVTGWKGQNPPAHVNCRSYWNFEPEI
jgi:SPP1 gp7 family putative phage head morphogenesis protein